MSASAVVQRFPYARSTGRGRWLARCVTHEDKRPSVAIRELDDGRVLLHCFAGCATDEILAALGLTFEDLFPERLQDHLPREKRPWHPLDILRALVTEAEIAALSADNLASGLKLSDA